MSQIGLRHQEEFDNWKITRCFIYLVLRCFAIRYVGDTIEFLFSEFKVSRIWHSSGGFVQPELCLLLQLCEVLVSELHRQVGLDGRLRTCVHSEQS
jgi:hypothetical protein